MVSFTIASGGPDETAQIAAVLARQLRKSDVVLLKGGLATGKTTFVQSVAKALGSADAVTSPTFALVHFYTTDKAPIMHVDAYRLSGVHEYRDLGLDEYLDESITLIEWGDIVEADFSCCLTVELTSPEPSSPDHRLLALSSDCPTWLRRLPVIQDELMGATARLSEAS
jgi:tRNA threonylcarbamoyladenosine biosynthesis protein TsaE